MSGAVVPERSAVAVAASYVPLGVHLAGSIPLGSAEEVFRAVAVGLGDRLRRIPDGETGARADWIVWQYPVLSSRPEFEVAPPGGDFYRALPRLKVRDGAAAEDIDFGSLGYADAALGSYRTFGELKRAGVVPASCRFQVCLPTPLAPISAFVAPENQPEIEERYAAAMMAELQTLLEALPHDQLAIQWDTNFEFGMLEGDLPAWFPDAKAGVLERLIRLTRAVPTDVELGFHFCYGDGRDARRRPQPHTRLVVDVANALTASIGRPLNWIHMPAAAGGCEPTFLQPLRDLRLPAETELYLGLLRPDEPAEQTLLRAAAAHELVGEFGLATVCGWGRLGPATIAALIAAHARVSRPVGRSEGYASSFAWPEGVAPIPDDAWTRAPLDTFGMRYDALDGHGWYRNLDPTVEQLASHLEPGDLLVDYSGGTGILLNRLLLRIFDRPIGAVIVDASSKFLRVAVEHFRDDPRIGVRLLRYLKDRHRLELLDEVLEPPLLAHKADALVSTNAIHLYTNLDETLDSWARVLRPGGRVFVNSGNVRNPEAATSEWILDETVYVVHEVASGIVRTNPRYARYRDVLYDDERVARYLEFRDKVFVAPRPLELYTEAFDRAGFDVVDVASETIVATIDDWFDLLSAYHEPVLGWVGGTEKIDGEPPSEEAVEDRLALIRGSLDSIFGGRPEFKCCWTYLQAVRRDDA